MRLFKENDMNKNKFGEKYCDLVIIIYFKTNK